jgi:hypothetical protein
MLAPFLRSWGANSAKSVELLWKSGVFEKGKWKGKMEGGMEVPQVGILLIALLYQKSPFLRTGLGKSLRKGCVQDYLSGSVKIIIFLLMRGIYRGKALPFV